VIFGTGGRRSTPPLSRCSDLLEGYLQASALVQASVQAPVEAVVEASAEMMVEASAEAMVEAPV